MAKKIGFVDLYLSEWHADNYPVWIKEAGAEYEVAYAWAETDISPVSGKSTDDGARSSAFLSARVSRSCAKRAMLSSFLLRQTPKSTMTLHGVCFPSASLHILTRHLRQAFRRQRRYTRFPKNTAPRYSAPPHFGMHRSLTLRTDVCV